MTAGKLVISKPGLYGNMPEADYHADPCPEPSASAHALLTLYQRSPLHAWHSHPKLNPNWQRDEPTADMVFGSAVHALLFGGQKIEVVDADSWRSKASQEQRAAAVARNEIPLLAKDHDRAQAMVMACKLQLEGHSVTKVHGSMPFTGGHPEMTGIWKRGDQWLRCRMDQWKDDHAVVYDYKTTSGSAHPEVWQRRLLEDGGAFQAILYPEAVMAALGLDRAPTFRLIVQETEAPYCLCVVELGESARDLASQQVEMAWRAWSHSLRTNTWPGYPPEIAAIQAPNWAFYKHQDRASAEREALISNPALLQ